MSIDRGPLDWNTLDKGWKNEEKKRKGNSEVEFGYDPWVSDSEPHSWIVEQIVDEPHTLIAGTTGCGKSTLLHAVICRLLSNSPDQIMLYMVDPKQIELYKYSDLPQVHKYAYSKEGMLEVIKTVSMEVDGRYNKIRSKGISYCPMYLLIDELADLMLTMAKDVVPYLQHILQLGRAANVHVIACTQCPNRRVIPAELVLNFTCRVGMRCLSAIESRQIVGIAGCEQLPRYGSMLFFGSDGEPRIVTDFKPFPEWLIQSKIKFWRSQAPNQVGSHITMSLKRFGEWWNFNFGGKKKK